MTTFDVARAAIVRALRSLGSEDDRKVFKAVVRNDARQRGGPIKSLARAGFVRLSHLWDDRVTNDELAAIVRRAPRCPASRTRMFQQVVGLVHRLGPSYQVYLGRTYLRRGQEHHGPRRRWRDHYETRDMEWGRALYVVPRRRILADEALGITLVKVWGELGALCCNNNVMLSNGPLSDDARQVIYLCVRRRSRRG